jgi:phosphoribosylformylglycinamidine synthase
MAPTAEVTPATRTAPHPPPDAWRVEVHRRPEREDPAGKSALQGLRELGIESVDAVRVGRGYLLPPTYTRAEVEELAAELLADPVVDAARIAAPHEPLRARAGGLHRIVVVPRPGVMDPVAGTLRRLLERTGRAPASGGALGTYRAYELSGAPTEAELELAATRLFANETVEIVRIDREDLPYGTALPAAPRGRVDVALRAAGDAELQRISRDGVLSLSLLEMRAIQAHFRAEGREPSACELETLAQTWSEHCKHKTLTGIVEYEEDGRPPERIDNLLKSTIAKATHELARPWCVSVFKDNAGIIAFDRGQDVCIKVETHNHPSAIDPYGGAGTGIGGVIRDVLGAGLGARPIASTDCFFVGPPDLPRDAVPKGTLHPRRILRGVVAGVRDYGNRMGIPTVNGGVWFDEAYVGNPLVYAGTVGLLPHAAAHKEVHPGDLIVALGGRTGRDGIHGATFSSAELHEQSEEVSGSAVQIGDPITEKRVLDALLQARDRGLYSAVTDCGAGGFSSAVGEMGEHTGAEVDVAKVPLKYHGLASHEIWISEAQERMVLSVPPDRARELLELCASEDVEATVIGTFTGTGRLVVKDGPELICDLPMRFLHEGTPRPVRRAVWRAPEVADPGCPAAPDAGAVLRALLAMPNIQSKEWIVRQYDHEVQGRSVAKAFVGARSDGPGDAAVLQPLAESLRGLAIACGANPAYGLLDPYRMAAAAIDEALRNAVAVGADPDQAALLDNFSWGNCEKPDRLGALVRAAKACYDAALAYGAPFISGKDSLNNEYRVGERTLAIPPTLLITALAIVPSVERVVTMDAKRAGDRLYLIGLTRPELGGSHYLMHRGLAGGTAPAPDLGRAPALLRALHGAIQAGLVAACHDLSEGGLAVAAAESAFAGDLGLELDLAAVPAEDGPGCDRDALRLFSESCTRFLVEVPPEHAQAFARRFAGLPCAAVGAVTADGVLRVRGVGGGALCAVPVQELRASFQGGFQG